MKSWLAPDLSAVAALAALLYCLVPFQGYRQLFRDSDSGWHIRTGETILATGALPHTDPYSFSRPAAPWVAWEWASDALMGAAHRVGGLAGVAALYAAAIALSVWLWFRLTWRVGGDFLLACLFAAPMLSTTNIHWLARPHIFSWIFLLAALLYAERQQEAFGWRDAGIVAAGTALWANFHASFFFAPLFALIYASGLAVRALAWDSPGGPDWRRAGWFAEAAAVSAAASFLNPYGWQLHRHLFAYLTDSELLARIGEFQSFNFHAEGALQILVALMLAALGGVAALSRGRIPHFLLAGLLTAAALRSARTLPLVALLVLPLANGALTDALAHAGGLRPWVRRSLDRALTYSARLRALDSSLGGVAAIPLVAAILWGFLHLPAIASKTGFPPDQFPVEAATALERLVPAETARILAPDKFGGYLIYRFDGRRKVFFDGRSDFYGTAFLKRYSRLVQLRPGWDKDLEEFGFTHALLPNDYSLVDALGRAGWKRLHSDAVSTLFLRP